MTHKMSSVHPLYMSAYIIITSMTCIDLSLKIAVVLLLSFLGTAQSVYKYQYPATTTSTYQVPAYPLGNLNPNDIVTIVMELPLGGAILMSSYVILSIMDASNTKTIVSFDDSNT